MLEAWIVVNDYGYGEQSIAGVFGSADEAQAFIDNSDPAWAMYKEIHHWKGSEWLGD